LVELGHEIGLHYDCEVLEHMDRCMEIVETNVKLLENLSGSPVCSIARHKPGQNNENCISSDQYIDAYGFMTTIPYFSDSCGAWRSEFINCVLSDNVPDQIQLLIHPEFWRQRPVDRWARLDECVSEEVAGVLGSAAEESNGWQLRSYVEEYDRWASGFGSNDVETPQT
jgi:hypothetical protein